MAVFIIGCGVFGGEDYYPLKVGNKWTYTGYVAMVSDATEDTTQTFIQQREIARSFKEGNIETFVEGIKTTSHLLPPYSPSDTTIVTIESVYVFTRNDTMFQNGRVTLVYPLEENKTWGDSSIGYYTVLNKEDVTVAAGNFRNCWKIRYVIDEDTSYFWLANNVGLVKLSQDWSIFGYLFRTRMELSEKNF
ncbi:MAG: hypothetical protein N2166_03590 [candidate division WOR-3 bacterium]|nr:hypothetical protein [candidate division WOR-3 bacterium]